jgi:predicted nucleic acid-binding protein
VSGRILIDTGPLVAAIDRHEQWHAWCGDRVRQAPAPLWTCESVISEAWFLLRRTDEGRESLVALLDRGALVITFDLRDHLPRVLALMRRYANVPMSLADACLVRMSEIVADCRVLTLDRDFRVYRRHGRKAIPLLIPPGR